MCCINIEGEGMERQDKGITYREFYFAGHRCVKILTHLHVMVYTW
jgi:hypothetical protein